MLDGKSVLMLDGCIIFLKILRKVKYEIYDKIVEAKKI